MLFVLVIIFFLLGRIKHHHHSDMSFSFYLLSGLFLVISFITVLTYNNTKASCDRKIAVLEERNELVIRQIEPIVNRYLLYESETLENLKISSETIIAFSAYPELKSNEFLKSQIDIIVSNQDEITNLKLSKAELNVYKLWIFMGE